MIEPQGVVHFSIAVSDLARSRTFYTEFSEWDGTSILD